MATQAFICISKRYIESKKLFALMLAFVCAGVCVHTRLYHLSLCFKEPRI
jgi:hypothetical protein